MKNKVDTGSAHTKRNRLPRKLGLTLMLLAAPVFVVSLSSFFIHVQELLHSEAMERANSILNTTMQRVVNYMAAIETAAKSNAWLFEENFNPDSLQTLSHRIVSLNASLISSSVSTEPDVFPEYGRHFSVYSVNEGDTVMTILETDFEYFERKWYRAALKTGNACWVDPFSDFNEGSINLNDAVASYCIPLRPNGRQIDGVLSADFSFNRLAEKVHSSECPFPSAYYMLLGTDGRYLIHPEENLLFKKTIFSAIDSVQHPDLIELGHEMTAGKKGMTHVYLNNEQYHVCYAPVPGTQWSLALVCLDDEVLADYNHLVHIIIVIVVVGLLLIMVITVRLVRHNIKPINQLLLATQKIAEGNYDEMIQPTDRKDDVAQLQNAFATMQQSLVSLKKKNEETREAISKENEELEQAMRQTEESLNEKQMFIRNITHRIHKPLTFIEGLSNMLLNMIASRSDAKSSDKAPKPEEIQNITTTLKHHAAYINRVALMLYDSSKLWISNELSYQRNENVVCNEVARECIMHTKTYYPKAEIHLETELPDSVCIRSNYLYLMRSIREIVYNAAKYSDNKHITLKVTQTENTVRFIVEDVGPGLSQEWRELLTQPFLKGEGQTAEGLGLGLPLTMRHIAGLGGELIYDDSYQQGCRIIVEMPKD